MEFGETTLEKAEGAVLAHSVPLPGGKRLRKGAVLGAADLAALRNAGISAVTVARLAPGDVDEDSAACKLAAALVPDAAAGLRLQPVGTGRVNILAKGPGVARIDAARITAVNRCDPTITLATVPPWQRMDAGEMVATVKIIAYGVDGAALARACHAAQGALSLAHPVMQQAELIQTSVGAPFNPEKGRRAIGTRLKRLGVALGPDVTVPHQIGALETALRAAMGELLLILTGSATSDIRDVAPEALRAAGGEVIHFGMPVDPGNLLFLGRLGGRPVIGLPGCARSPALNGADWVMERVICGITLQPEDIMGMGVGGLLKEIPSRPRPRAVRETPDAGD